ncbi:ectoine/hydroxyectoine ABC transporter permease subunit EhuC [Achromobacter anxifer]|jgi:polar amino acid transport system permease protein|uniref:Ectoine/hydroxyectoine ABC transporter permease subunit EhuC n=1 Tax=Alcaligenes xylosoxydans xylosoxydans TaxID=85698 RepID=A0A424WCZ1_ALCXX|nr:MULTISPECIES: ectoine/hydroxyectoine ABC transporter permease subunit EhuC [Achromobacter]MBD0867247.1 ectoine/hydroxyectoine ABC transporter permease subunit EhuC [Achromobacter xylosoxidans]MDH1304169.1 ectoine/hydroxyectoine ABC transporter permease subunit EhuC [Achromobacter sp. GD03932]QNP88276.1 ectoine/hydroxyectoine ABC transporter permease subunit EhuC [Achromobacter xylosoxidans]RPJ91110.1 ectoine/hydroxyectoine ABC transporter permease subunit EhuC [Achromobacter xylosoxidans]WL
MRLISEHFAELAPPLLQGLAVTLEIMAGAVVLAVPLALAAGIGRLSSLRPLRWIAAVYVEVFRGTSALVQLFWFYFVLPLFGVQLPAMLVGIVVLALNAGAYGAEVVRGAIRAVPPGQREAGIALNLTRGQIMRRIVVPQAVPAMLPPAGNLLIELLKNTALVSLITITDLTFRGQLLRSETLRTTEIFTLMLLMYFAVALLITGGVRLLERKVRVR